MIFPWVPIDWWLPVRINLLSLTFQLFYFLFQSQTIFIFVSRLFNLPLSSDIYRNKLLFFLDSHPILWIPCNERKLISWVIIKLTLIDICSNIKRPVIVVDIIVVNDRHSPQVRFMNQQIALLDVIMTRHKLSILWKHWFKLLLKSRLKNKLKSPNSILISTARWHVALNFVFNNFIRLDPLLKKRFPSKEWFSSIGCFSEVWSKLDIIVNIANLSHCVLKKIAVS